MDFPGIWVPPLLISSVSKYGTLEPTMQMFNGYTAATSGVFAATTGDVVLAPFTIPGPYEVRSMYWYNGSASMNGNVTAGIYTVNTGSTTLTRLCTTTATAQSGTISIQTANTTSTVRLTPGTYYFALTNSGTGPFYGRAVPTLAPLYGLYAFGWQSATPATPGTLPATLTASTFTGTRYPWIGCSRLSSGQY